MGKLRNLGVVVFAVVLMVLSGVEGVKASSIPFGVEVVPPEGQEAGVSNYVSILAEDGFKRDITLELSNKTEEEIKVKVGVVNAYTSPSGVIQYTEKAPESSKIIEDEYKMDEHLSIEEEVVTIQGKGKKEVTLQLEVDKLEGVLLGGIVLQEQKEEEEGKEGQQFTIKNEVNMVIGVKVDFGGVKKVKVDVGDPLVVPMPAYYTVRLPIEVDTPQMKVINFKYTVERKGKEVFGNEMELGFAPKTGTSIRIPWESDEIERNKLYVLKGLMVYRDVNGQDVEKEFEKEFIYEVNTQSTKDVVDLGVPVERGGGKLWLLLGVVVIVTLLVVYTMRKRKLYSLYSDDTEVPNIIEEDDELYKKVGKEKKVGYLYQHEYRKETGGKNKYYVYVRTVEVEEGRLIK